MQRHRQLQPDRLTASLVGLALLFGSALFADAARIHMAGLGHICGGAAPHCAACYAAFGSALAALLAFATALRPQPRTLRIRGRD